MHDHGCRFAREDNGGHTDAARRLSDTYNLHKLAGAKSGYIAVRFADGSSDDTVYPTRAEAVSHQRHNERWCAYIQLNAGHMSVCEAAATLRFQAHASKLAPAQSDQRGGGMVVIPRLNIEDQERQIAALSGRIGLPVALGRSN